MNQTIQITVDDEQDLQWLHERAQATGRSFADLVRDVIHMERQRRARWELLREIGPEVTTEDLRAALAAELHEEP